MVRLDYVPACWMTLARMQGRDPLSSLCSKAFRDEPRKFLETKRVSYSAVQTFEDVIARHRIKQGEEATSIDLGTMTAEVMLVENQGLLTLLGRSGLSIEITQTELFALLDHYRDPSLPLQSPTQPQAIVGIEISAVLDAMGRDIPLFRHFIGIDSKQASVQSEIANTAPGYVSTTSKASSSIDTAGYGCRSHRL